MEYFILLERERERERGGGLFAIIGISKKKKLLFAFDSQFISWSSSTNRTRKP
jgi:hypothetical protein